MSIFVSVFLIIHGLIHLIGFIVPWKLAVIEGFTYKTTILSGALDIGETGIRLVGTIWLLAAVGFVTGGILLLLGNPQWQMLTLAVTLLSLLLTISGWPDSQFGVLVNIIILASLYFL